MADGMSFVFQIDANTPGLDDLLGKLDKANVSMSKGHAALKGLDTGAHHASEGAKELGGAFSRAVEKGLDPFLHKAKEIAEFEFIREGTEKLLEFPGELAEKIKDLGEEIVEAAAHEERLGRAFENALGPNLGKETLEYFEAIADKTEFTHGQIKGMGLELAKSGFQGENLKSAIAAAADLASMTDNPLMGGTEAVEALKRIMTTGRIEGRALLPFGIQKGEFEKELSAETGLGLKAMHKEMEAGKIPIETTLNSLYKTITDKTGQDLGGVGTAMTDTLTSRLAHLKEKPDLFFEGMKDTRGFHELSDFIAQTSEALDPKSALGQILSGSLESAFNGVGDMLSTINLEDVVREVGHVVEGLPDDIKKASDFVTNDFVPAIKEVWADFKEIKSFVEETVADLRGVRDFIDPFAGHGPAFKQEKNANQALLAKGGIPEEHGGVKDWIKDKVIGAFFPGYDTVKEAIPKFQAAMALREAAAHDVAGYSKGIDDATPAATAAMSTLADKTTDALKTAHEQHSPSALFRRIAELDVAGYTEGAMGQAFAPAVNAGAGAAGAATLSIASIVVHVDGHGAGGEDLGRRIATGIEDQLEVALLRFFERIARRKGG
jgi:hypothetical protein